MNVRRKANSKEPIVLRKVNLTDAMDFRIAIEPKSTVLVPKGTTVIGHISGGSITLAKDAEMEFSERWSDRNTVSPEIAGIELFNPLENQGGGQLVTYFRSDEKK